MQKPLLCLLLFLVACTSIEEPIVEIKTVEEELEETKQDAILNKSVEVREIEDKLEVTEREEKKNTAGKPEHRISPEIPLQSEREQLPECEGKYFEVDPVDLKVVKDIAPLGNLGPPGHTYPTDHSYISVNDYGNDDLHELYAPANVVVLHIATSKGSTQDPEDSTIYFALCKDVIGYYNHVKELSPEIQQIVKESGCEGKPHTGHNSCNIQVMEPVKSGSVMGKVGAKQGNFDFGLIDLRKNLGFINSENYGYRTSFIQCAYDYYKDNSRYYNIIERDDDAQCGTTMQDIPGTLKGNWIHVDTTNAIGQWNNYLAFVQDNYHPETEVVSVGGIITDPGKFEFKPRDSGVVNREFSHVTANKNIYCYEAEEMDYFQNSIAGGRVLVRMLDDAKLEIEHQSGKCGSSLKFTEPEIYKR